MSTEPNGTPIVIEATDRRSLLMTIVERLRDLLPVGEVDSVESAMLEPWQVTAPTFDALPERLIASLADRWSTADGRCVDLEMQGYLETDAGPRVWGVLSVQPDTPVTASSVELTDMRYTEVAGTYRIEAIAVSTENTNV